MPLVLWHGAGQFSKTWETTPDGREGFQNLFLRRRFSVYLLDQPRRGDAGRSTVASTIPAATDDQVWFGMFRFGVWPDLFPGVQFSRSPEALEQFFRSMTPNTGPFDAELSARAVAALFDKIGPGILVTHSQGGGPGWLTVMKSANVRAVVSYEPGSGFVFPEGEVPAPMSSLTGPLEGVAVPRDQFMALTRIPIVIYFGDNIPAEPSPIPGLDNWRVRLAMARQWRDAVNRHGGDVTVVHLPELGIRGNTHFLFSDTNNVEIANLLSRFLAEKQLDGGTAPAAQRGDAAATGTGQQILRASTQASIAGPMDHFTGRVRVDRLSPGNGGINASTAYVTFEPGARSAWHTHPRGQYLVVTAGTGLTQEWDKPVQELRPGDVVWCPPGVKHWHGAAKTAAMTHLAVTGIADGKSVSWMETVSDAQYDAPPATAPRGPETSTTAPLSVEQQTIPPIAAFMATSDMPRLNAALNEGLDAGLTISESKEILVQLYAYTGFPRSLNALGELMKVVEARRQRGIQDAPGREPGRAVLVGDALVAVGTANQTKISGAPVRGPLFDFAPVINRFLQAHLFGDIFERDNLDWQSRELATVGALAATPGVEPQLRSHMAASLRVGLTAEQLLQLAGWLAERVDADAGKRANEALTKALEALKKE